MRITFHWVHRNICVLANGPQLSFNFSPPIGKRTMDGDPLNHTLVVLSYTFKVKVEDPHNLGWKSVCR